MVCCLELLLIFDPSVRTSLPPCSPIVPACTDNPTLGSSDRSAALKALFSKIPKASEVRLPLSRCSRAHSSPADLSLPSFRHLLRRASPSQTTINLLDVLSVNGRLTATSDVVADFITLSKAHKGEVEVTVTSAEPLDKTTQDRLERALKGSEAAKGKTMKIVNKVSAQCLSVCGENRAESRVGARPRRGSLAGRRGKLASRAPSL